MGAKDTNVSRNMIYSSNGAAGIGVMIGAVANFLFEKNSVRYNAKALYIDGKEKEKGIKRFIIDNEIAYNGEAFHFHATIKDNKIIKNRVYGNIEDVVKDVAGSFDTSNRVMYNYWDRYSGFDRDGDGIGDTPYEVYQYADKLWQYNHTIKFFYASPIMTLLNFLSQLAPFIEPNMIMKDSKPQMYMD
jgi:nitrous oxidase accessory protein